jgi:hypothetical protein
MPSLAAFLSIENQVAMTSLQHPGEDVIWWRHRGKDHYAVAFVARRRITPDAVIVATYRDGKKIS